MKMKRIRTSICLALAVMAVAWSNLIAEPKTESPLKPSAYAPAKDLVGQFDYFFNRIEEDLADAEEFEKEQQQRIARDANTLAVLALVLGKHDEKNDLKRSAAALIGASTELADNAKEFTAARKALAAVKAARGKKASRDDLKWQAVGDLQQLMLQVPIVNNSLRRGVSGRRFKRSADKIAGQAATLAAIAQASMLDTGYCSDKKDEQLWIKACAEMRDASAAVGAATRKVDQKAAQAALDRLAKTCDACHKSFRD